jgi:hydroxylaminobenzene mutase
MTHSDSLLAYGTALFFLGLLNGLLLPFFPNYRQGLSAHLAGVQDAMVLWAFGLMWNRVRLRANLRRIAALAAIYSMYAIWAGLALGAAASGYHARAAANILEGSGSLAILAASLCVFVGLIRRQTHSAPAPPEAVIKA